MVRNFAGPIALALVATICAQGTAPAHAQSAPAVKGICLTTGETREEIKSRHLLEPFVALKSAAATVSSPKNKAEALSARLCRLGEEYVYEIALLHRDGRLVHVVMSAVTGKIVNTHISHEAPPRT
jgi:hypothetical protein